MPPVPAVPHDACRSALITVNEGKATKIQGDPAHPVTRGFLCAKVAKYLDRVYSPDRVLYPMKRVGAKDPRAEGEASPFKLGRSFGPSPDRFQKIVSQFGSEAILPYSYGGTLGVLNGAGMDRRFFHRLGASQLDRTIC